MAIVYSAYVPFLRAAINSRKKLMVVPIITDLPEYYDLGKTSLIRRFFRKLNNRSADRLIRESDKYVFLTRQMAEKYSIPTNKYVVVEGICDVAEIENENQPKNDFDEDNKTVFFYSGTLLNAYGIKDLLFAFSQIQSIVSEFNS